MRRVVIFSALVVTSACAAPLPRAREASQPATALVEVERPPPPARVEILPPRPSAIAVWIDGEWIWRRGRWAWLPGRWVEPPEGASFAVWTFERGPDGRLWYAPGAWRDATGAEIAAPKPLAFALVEVGAVVDAEGRTETTGPVLRDRPSPTRSPADER